MNKRQQMADMIRYLRRSGIQPSRNSCENLQPIYYKKNESDPFYVESKLEMLADLMTVADVVEFLSSFGDDMYVQISEFTDYDDQDMIRIVVLEQTPLNDDQFYEYLCDLIMPHSHEQAEFEQYTRLKKKFEGA